MEIYSDEHAIEEQINQKIAELMEIPAIYEDGFVWLKNIIPSAEEFKEGFIVEGSLRFRLGKESSRGRSAYFSPWMIEHPRIDQVCGVYSPIRDWLRWYVKTNIKQLNDPNLKERVRQTLFDAQRS
jgi:hypothetical protein